MAEPQVCSRQGCGGGLVKGRLTRVAAKKLGKDFWLGCTRCFAGYVMAVDGKLRLVLEGLLLGSFGPAKRPGEKVVAK